MLHYKRSKTSRIFDAVIIALLILLSAIFLYPFLFTLSESISDTHAIAQHKVFLYPVGFDLSAYKAVFNDSSIMQSYENTILYSVVFTIFVLVFCSLIAYTLSYNNFRAKKAITLLLTITMFVSGGMIPLYLLLQIIHIRNTMWAVVLPGSVSAWYVFIIRTNFSSIPMELKESAFIDGASHWRVLLQIVMPLSLPILATIGLFSMVQQWNSFFYPMIFLDDTSKMPLQVILRELIISNSIMSSMNQSFMLLLKGNKSVDSEGYFEAMKTAAVIVSIGPIIIVYPFIQKYFVKGILIGAVKG